MSWRNKIDRYILNASYLFTTWANSRHRVVQLKNEIGYPVTRSAMVFVVRRRGVTGGVLRRDTKR